MRLFKSNKSQASIEDRLAGSRDGSPTDPAYNQHGQQQHHPHHQPQHQHQPHSSVYSGSQFDHSHSDRLQRQQHQQQQQSHLPPPSDPQYQDLPSQSQSHPQPPHHLIRSQSGRSPSAGDLYGAQRPSVNIVPPHSQQQQQVIPEGPAPIPGQTSFGQSKNVRVIEEKAHKKSKRSFITSLIKDKPKDEEKDREKDKENSSTEPPPRKGIGRSSSVHLLRKSQPDHSRDSYSQQNSPQQYSNRHSVFYQSPDSSAPPQSEDQIYDQYHRGPPQTQGSGQYDSPQSQNTHQSVDYIEDAPSFSPQQESYQAYHISHSANNSEHYLPYQAQPAAGNEVGSGLYSHLRPPSQASLGPPSPIINAGQIDSRPSTGATNTNRFSAQSANQQHQPPPQQAMGRDRDRDRDQGNGSLRQQLSQRDPRADEHTQYQGQSQQDPRLRMSQQVSDQGRSTPPPRTREDIGQLDYHQLLQRHEELQAKYSKVKRYYFEREAQVTQLQNTVANQRLSMSKTSLDDAQYTARFERLSNAINNLAFNIRKNWRAVPPWLRHVCNQDAHTVGTKEMTAVGRACITRWLFESIFERTFHPGIDPGLSAQLKNVERNLRRSGQAGLLLTDEQRDDLTTKITTWRLTTIEGLGDVLTSPQAEQYIENLNKMFTHQLTESLKANLTDPPPPGLSEGVSMIVGQAIGVAANIPLESRDICIEYFMPGTPVNETYMKIEPQMTPLTNPGPDERLLAMQQAQQQAMQDAQDAESTASTDDGPRERDVEAEIREAAGKAASQSTQQPGGQGGGPGAQVDRRNDSTSSQATVKGSSGDSKSKKSSFLGGFVSKKAPPNTRNPQAGQDRGETGSNASGDRDVDQQQHRGTIRESMAVDPSQLGVPPPGANEGRIRFAAFLAIEVRSKGAGNNADRQAAGKEPGSAATGTNRESAVNVLFKAPVYEH